MHDDRMTEDARHYFAHVDKSKLEELTQELERVKAERDFLAKAWTERDLVGKSDILPLVDALRGVLDSALHPEMAVRAVMVPLDPIRKAIAHASKLGLT